jgi:iron complex outermembrane receptor protein
MMPTSAIKRRLLVTAAAAVAITPVAAFAQDGGAPANAGVNEIIVTAQKREERLQDVPLAVTAIGGDQIAARGFTNITQVTRMAPNVNVNEGIVNPTLITPFIRGIGTIDNSPESDMPVAVSIDGVYLASVYGGLIDAFDIQQVEILRGPQGTLQGRNAPGGAINITTRRPGDEWVVRGMVEYGKFSDIRMNLGVDGPLIEDKLGIKLAAMYRNADGFMKNVTTGEKFGGRDTFAMKAGLKINPNDNIDIWLSGDYSKDKSPPTAFRDVNDGITYNRPEYADQTGTAACGVFDATNPLCTPSPKRTTRQSKFGNNKITNWGLSSNINIDAGAVTFTSVTGYRKIKDTYFLDIDATPLALLENKPTVVDQKTFSQEFRIASNDGGSATANGLLRWLIGGYYMHSKMFRDQELFFSVFSIGTDYGQTLKSKALFGQVEIMPTEALSISLGARESWDNKSFIVPAIGSVVLPTPLTAKAKWKKFMYDATVNYKLSPDHMIYARYARGSRPGGFNQSLDTYNPETVDSIEGGVKTSWMDRRLTLNLAGFYYKYKGIQRQTSVAYDDDGDGVTDRFARPTTNAGAAHAYGLELEMNAQPIDGLNLNFGLGYLDAKYDSWDDADIIGSVQVPISNATLPVFQAPKWTINAGISYEIPVSEEGVIAKITPSANIYHKSSHYTNTEAQPVSFENGYSLVSAALRLEGPDNKYAVTFFGENLTNAYFIQNGGTLGGLGAYVQEGRPRTYGVRLEFQFK